MENVTYQQLALLPKDELTAPQQTFLAVHNEMLMASQKAAECLLIVANDMKRMRDEELYRAAGFETFRDYVETALDIKERQAYNWISILSLPEEYLTKNARMGVTKLALIASASGEVADRLMADEETSEKSVRELAATIKQQEEALNSKNEQIRLLTDELEEQKAESISQSEHEQELRNVEDKLKAAQDDLAAATDRLTKKEAEIEKLKKQKAKVVEKTVEKPVDNPETQKALEEAQAEMEKAKADKAVAEEQAKKATEELAAYKKTQEAIATFKVCAENLFGVWDDVLSAVNTINDTDSNYAAKCKAKLAKFIEVAQRDLEG